ncbi:DUF4848 domain-containing protein [Olivibacter jilunii]|uniref:DUF4848 domain-containing protein n=1 Tax=Olivibacter jilunii TaxID=985016 RepID=UPI003F154C33
MKFFYSKFALAVAISSMVFSCKKGETLQTNRVQSKEEIRVENGMLVFKNADVLKRTVQQISQLSPEEYANWVKKYPGFDSYKYAFNAAIDEFEKITSEKEFLQFKDKYKEIVHVTKDTSLIEKFASPVISSFVNKAGQFRVGDSLNVLTEDRWILLTSSDRGKLSKALSLNKTDSVNGIYISDYRKEKTLSPIKSNKVEIAAPSNAIITAEPNPPYFAGQYLFKHSSDYMRSSGVYFDQTYYNGDRDRRLIVKLIHDVYPTGGDDFRPTSTSIFSLYVNQESKKLFGWGANNTSFDVKIDYIVVGRLYYVPSGYLYENYGSNGLNWQKGDTKGPYTFTLFNGHGYEKAMWGSMRIWSRGVPDNPTNI